MSKRQVCVAAALVVALTARAAADPEPTTQVIHLKTESTVHTDGGSDLRLPPGYFVEERLWWEFDDEMKRLQTSEVRLKAENASLRKSAKTLCFDWKVIAVGVAAGFAAGAVFVLVK